MHHDIQEQYHEQLSWQPPSYDDDNFYQPTTMPCWMNRLPSAYKDFYMRYAEKNSGKAVDDMLAVHTMEVYRQNSQFHFELSLN